ncbi:hypothetical protein OUZ56_021905 [Daphnia magna]|uniref:Uncharacterized protein n=1 Tax=Daphnia magna TaxID=35525 RepID=A0ABR0AUS9_9CRUS|nr:hypothetical protein OUZ56_021905 [Daphnia magna]
MSLPPSVNLFNVWRQTDHSADGVGARTVLNGRNAYRQVTWFRRKDFHLLTVGHAVYSSDERFHVQGPMRSTQVTS